MNRSMLKSYYKVNKNRIIGRIKAVLFKNKHIAVVDILTKCSEVK